MKIVLAMLLCVLVLLQLRLWTGAGSLADIARLEQAIAKQGEENASLAARNGVVMDDISDLRNGLDSIEERARNELGLIRQGETFYLMVDREPEDERPEPQPAQTVNPAPLPQQALPAPPLEAAEDDNPYLELFRDEAEASSEAGNTQARDDGLH